MGNLDQGVTCPCCDQLAKLYSRKFNRNMAVCLIEMYRLVRMEPAHVRVLTDSKLFKDNMHGGNFATSRYWGVIEQLDREPEEEDIKRTSGTWRLTNSGLEFIMGRLRLPRHIFTYNGTYLGSSGEDDMIDVSNALGSPFNYSELMGNDWYSRLRGA